MNAPNIKTEDKFGTVVPFVNIGWKTKFECF